MDLHFLILTYKLDLLCHLLDYGDRIHGEYFKLWQKKKKKKKKHYQLNFLHFYQCALSGNVSQ